MRCGSGVRAMARPGASFTADPAMADHYAARYRTFGAISDAMTPIWADMAAARISK